MTNEEIRELKNQLRDTERERDKIAYMLVKAQDEIEGLEAQVEQAQGQVLTATGQIAEIRAALATALKRDSSSHIMNLVDEATTRLGR